MIADTSAIVAILLQEDDHERFSRALIAAPTRRLSCVSHLECSIATLRKLGTAQVILLDDLLARLKVELVDFTPAQAKIARRAYARFGKSVHTAGLNFGDCASYALAIETGEPLLYKGEDFALTDVVSALPPR
ncbi:MAG TPA: type II toxin-antitoxin system VapC family toxin [Candidatus Baltobacteraceae bacterium]|nr:type II toxin-antitoxin system VapC family toxin [Candidatus Baltobacteraceae bacterium]